jgi:hypothetical protein
MNVKKLVQGLSYSGEVEGKRQTYYVFAGAGFFLVLSFSKTKPRAGNFNIVDSGAVAYVRKRFGGKRGITTVDVAAKARRTRHIPSTLAALNVLYVLVATGQATIDTRRSDPKLFFNVKG